MMQFHQPSLRNRSSSWSEISASNTCLRSMTLYLAYHCTGNLSRGVSVWFRYGRTFKGHGSRNGTLFTSDGSGEGPCASTATSPTMKRNKVSCRDHNSQPRPGESVPALQRRRSSKANPGNSTSPCVASCAKADASETEISRVLVSGSFSTQTQEVLQPEESLSPPLWQTFASNASGVWGGVGAIFSPTTGEMEAVCVGPKSQCLYDAHIMCTVETAEVRDGAKATIGLKRTMLWRADNAHVENGSGDKPVLDTDSNVDPTNQPAQEAVNFRGESGEATLLGEINSSSLC